MKKIALILALVFMLTVTLVSCGGNYDDGAPDLGNGNPPNNESSGDDDAKSDVQYDRKYMGYTYNIHNGTSIEITAYDFEYSEESDNASEDEEEFETIELIIPDKINGISVTKIGSRAFASNRTLSSVVVPEGVTEIADEAFWFNYCLEGVTLPASLKTLGKRVFNYCPVLKTLEIPEAVTEIPAELCDECLALETLTIGSGVTKIASKAFNNCVSLETLNFNGNASELVVEDGNDAVVELLSAQ